LASILQAPRHINHALAFIRWAQSFTVRSYHSSNRPIIPSCNQADGTLHLTDSQTNSNGRPANIQMPR
jgi:hypothetical protein